MTSYFVQIIRSENSSILQQQPMQRLRSLYHYFFPPQDNIGDRLTIRDNRTNRTIDISISQTSRSYFIRSEDLAHLTDSHQESLKVYDPGYVNTISNTSQVCYIDGKKGILLFRGYPIDQLADKSSFMEVTFLLLNGQLPSADQLDSFSHNVMSHTIMKEQLTDLMKSFRYDAHPMGMLISVMSACSTLYPQANPAIRRANPYIDRSFINKQVYRILGLLPTIAANTYRHRIGRPYNQPKKGLGYVENLLYMLDHLNQKDYKSHPKLVKAMQTVFIVYAEHGTSSSTAFVRHMASSDTDIYTVMAMGAGALWGPKHGGANIEVIKMLESIGTKDNIRKFLMQVKLKKRLLFGFGNRIYKSYDPRAKILKKVAFDVIAICGKQPLIEVAIELQRIALSDDFFITRQLYPNVDFYSGLIYRAMGFPTDMFPVLYTIPRMAGWLAHFIEFIEDPQSIIYRPRQNYQGPGKRGFVGMSERQDHPADIGCPSSKAKARRDVSIKYALDNSD